MGSHHVLLNRGDVRVWTGSLRMGRVAPTGGSLAMITLSDTSEGCARWHTHGAGVLAPGLVDLWVMSGHAAVSHRPAHIADVPGDHPLATLPSQRFHSVPPCGTAARSQIWSPARSRDSVDLPPDDKPELRQSPRQQPGARQHCRLDDPTERQERWLTRA